MNMTTSNLCECEKPKWSGGYLDETLTIKRCVCGAPFIAPQSDTNERKMEMKPIDETGYKGLDSSDTREGWESAGVLRVSNFKCSEHGLINPVPKCPKCFDSIIAQERRKAEEAFMKLIEHKRLTEPMDVTDESLADIASDTKGEAWMIGYNAAIDNILESARALPPK